MSLECEGGGGGDELRADLAQIRHEVVLLDLIWTVILLICTVIVSNVRESMEASE